MKVEKQTSMGGGGVDSNACAAAREIITKTNRDGGRYGDMLCEG